MKRLEESLIYLFNTTQIKYYMNLHLKNEKFEIKFV